MYNGGKLMKLLLVTVNLINMVIGIFLIAFFSYVLAKEPDFLNLLITFIILGCVIVLISFLGCYGSLSEDNCLLITYSIIMFVILSIRLALIVYLMVNENPVIDVINNLLENVWANHEVNPNKMNYLQEHFDCCGLNGYQDYKNDVLPASCCGNGATFCSILSPYLNPSGCSKTIEHIYSNYGKDFFYFGFAVVAVDFFSIIFGFVLGIKARNSRESYH